MRMAGVAVAAFVDDGGFPVRAAPPAVGLGDHERSARQHRRDAAERRDRALPPPCRADPGGPDRIGAPRRGCACGASGEASARTHLGSSPSATGCSGGPRRGARRVVHERRRRGAARQRLDAQCTRPGVQVEHPRARHAVAENGEERLAHPVRRGACGVARRRLQPAPAVATGDHAHGEDDGRRPAIRSPAHGRRPQRSARSTSMTRRRSGACSAARVCWRPP